MPNDSAPWPNKSTIREDKAVSADTLTRIVNALSRRIVGDNKTIAVRSFPGGQLLIEALGKTQVKGGVSATEVRRVPELPAIPEEGMLEVYWYHEWVSSGHSGHYAGTGDNQVWRVYAGQTRWYPTQKITNLSGVPTP